jgi:hypothetical protein
MKREETSRNIEKSASNEVGKLSQIQTNDIFMSAADFMIESRLMAI